MPDLTTEELKTIISNCDTEMGAVVTEHEKFLVTCLVPKDRRKALKKSIKELTSIDIKRSDALEKLKKLSEA